MNKLFKKLLCFVFAIMLTSSAFCVNSFGAGTDNRILWGTQNSRGSWSGQDNFDFRNMYVDFFNSTTVGTALRNAANSEYTIADNYFNFLTKGMSNTVWSYLYDMRHSHWDGSCYGMSAAASLFKTGKLTPSFYTKNAKVANDLDAPAYSTDVKNLINFYQLLSGLPDIQNYYDTYFLNGKNRTAQLKKMVTEAQKVKTGGMPVIVSYSYLSNNIDDNGVRIEIGHAILAYDVANGKFKFGNSTYSYKVSILDPNYKEPKYMYVNSVFSDWDYEGLYDDDNTNKSRVYSNQKDIIGVFASEKTINLINPETGENNTKLKNFASNYAYDSLGFSNANLIDETGVKFSKTYISVGTTNAIIPDKTMYKFLVKDTTKSISSYLLLKNCYSAVAANNCKYYSLKSTGDFDFSADNTAYYITLTYNKAISNLDTFRFEIEGNKISKCTVTATNNGLLISGNNLKNTTVTAKNRSEIDELNINTKYKNVLIRDIDSDTVAAFIDKNSDGVYETEITESIDLTKSKIIIFFERIAQFFKNLFR